MSIWIHRYVDIRRNGNGDGDSDRDRGREKHVTMETNIDTHIGKSEYVFIYMYNM